MGNIERRGRIIGVRFNPRERAYVEGEAFVAGLTLSDFVRHKTLAGIPEGFAVVTRVATKKPARPRKSRWTIEWERMEQMSSEDAAAHFRKLSAGRALPPEFRGWL